MERMAGSAGSGNGIEVVELEGQWHYRFACVVMAPSAHSLARRITEHLGRAGSSTAAGAIRVVRFRVSDR